ncbi:MULTISPECIES: ABC transporter ATP-binding protein [Cobetia]|uniref:ABC transporter ATP-binding protein n=1 Tax=Cobetia TaxID=204286 RepID=UPI0009E8F923|nr:MULTISPECIES: ABC transporter ATP-binding protein [Cobetia]MDH2421824.1 ATP-binding cassette domain-containing protein [Cobetia litoralis]
MIEIKSLYKRYHNHHSNEWVLRDINIIIPTGVSVGLIGGNGAGKSTLLRLIAGMDTPDRGEVIRHSRVSWPVGLSGGMQGSLTGRQNVKFVARAQGRRNDVERIVSFVEDFAEIGSAFDDPVKTYSSGMKSRLSFGLSLAFDFDVFISDEATAVGDRAFKAKAKALFKSKVGKSSLIIVSHGEGILRELCQAGIYLKNGSAYWFDDINDAIIAYHDDGNQAKKLADSTASKVIDVREVDQKPSDSVLSAERLEEVREVIKNLQPIVAGIGITVNKAKQNNWATEKIKKLNGLHDKTKKEMKVLQEIISEDDRIKIQEEKKNFNQYNKAIKSLQYLKDHLQKYELESEELDVIESAIELMQKNMLNAKANIESLED